MDDTTLGGYQHVHGRPPAFGAADGRAYSVATFTADAAAPAAPAAPAPAPAPASSGRAGYSRSRL